MSKRPQSPGLALLTPGDCCSLFPVIKGIQRTPRGSPYLLDAVQDVLKCRPKDRRRGKIHLQAAWEGYTWSLIRTFQAGCTGVSGRCVSGSATAASMATKQPHF